MSLDYDKHKAADARLRADIDFELQASRKLEQKARDALEKLAAGVRPVPVYAAGVAGAAGVAEQSTWLLGDRTRDFEPASRDEVQILRTRVAQMEARIRALESRSPQK